MALINLDSAMLLTLRALKKIEPPGGIQLLSYKRNRKISITREEGDNIHVHQMGYENKTYSITRGSLPKLLKNLFKKEFPRSRKIRLVSFHNPDELKRDFKKI